MIYFGYDPGGGERGGVAILDTTGAKPTYETGLTGSVDEAIGWGLSSAQMVRLRR